MKATYDYEIDTLPVIFSEAPVAKSDEDEKGVMLDYDGCGNVMKTLHHCLVLREETQVTGVIGPECWESSRYLLRS